MKKVSSAIVLSVVAASAAAALIFYNMPSRSNAVVATSVGSQFDASAAVEERLAALERVVSEERQARQLLEEELQVLYAALDQLENGRNSGPGPADIARREAERQTRIANETANGFSRREEIEQQENERRRNAMIAEGMSPDRADYVLKRESEMRYEVLKAYHKATTSGGSFDRFSMSPEVLLRADIGDSDYEKYLLASGRGTTISVGSVMAASPAERAGLQPGDEIVSYDGERVFSTSELMQRTMAPGEGDVVVDVVRDGVPIQVVLPRGPIGVEAGRNRSR